MADAFERILGQPQVRAFLRAVVAQGGIGQAYLFTGPAGSNKTLAAYALAQAVICEQRGCGACDACRRVMRSRCLIGGSRAESSKRRDSAIAATP